MEQTKRKESFLRNGANTFGTLGHKASCPALSNMLLYNQQYSD